jgi:hypothetical protein
VEAFLFFACYRLSLLHGWCVVYVGDASVSLAHNRLLPLFNKFFLIRNRINEFVYRNNVSPPA